MRRPAGHFARAAAMPANLPNNLAFLAVDHARRRPQRGVSVRYLACTSILDEKDGLEPLPAAGPPRLDQSNRPRAPWLRAALPRGLHGLLVPVPIITTTACTVSGGRRNELTGTTDPLAVRAR